MQGLGTSQVKRGLAIVTAGALFGSSVGPGGGTALGSGTGTTVAAGHLASGAGLYALGSPIGADGMDRVLFACGVYGEEYTPTLSRMGAAARQNDWATVSSEWGKSLVPGQAAALVFTAWEVYQARTSIGGR